MPKFSSLVCVYVFLHCILWGQIVEFQSLKAKGNKLQKFQWRLGALKKQLCSGNLGHSFWVIKKSLGWKKREGMRGSVFWQPVKAHWFERLLPSFKNWTVSKVLAPPSHTYNFGAASSIVSNRHAYHFTNRSLVSKHQKVEIPCGVRDAVCLQNPAVIASTVKGKEVQWVVLISQSHL